MYDFSIVMPARCGTSEVGSWVKQKLGLLTWPDRLSVKQHSIHSLSWKGNWQRRDSAWSLGLTLAGVGEIALYPLVCWWSLVKMGSTCLLSLT